MRDHFLPHANPETLESSLAALEPDAHGLTILPFWAGERSTGWSLSARGGIFGLSNNTKAIEIVRATMEAIAYRFALLVEALEPFAQNPTIVASGNALRSSRAWMQIIADVIGRPLALSDVREASMRGAALLALEAAGKIQNIETANDLDTEVEPQLSNHGKYHEALKRQQRLYGSVIG
jgi:gluconokinase